MNTDLYFEELTEVRTEQTRRLLPMHDVRAIRYLVDNDLMTRRELAAFYHVKYNVMCRIVSRHTCPEVYY